MPVKKCKKDGKSGYKWGDSGACFTGSGGRERARKQGIAIESSKNKKSKGSKHGGKEKTKEKVEEKDKEKNKKKVNNKDKKGVSKGEFYKKVRNILNDE